MANQNETGSPSSHVEEPRLDWWTRLIGYAKRKINERAAKKKNETPADKAARRTAVATIWMAIFTCILAVTSGLTIWILKNQLKEMHEGGIDTHALAEAADDASGAASDQADAAQQFSDTAEDINHRMSEAVDQLSAADRNMRTTIKNAQTAFRDEQRAWVGVSGASLTQFESGKPIRIEVAFFNSGKTPAIHVHKANAYIVTQSPMDGPTPEMVADFEKQLPGQPGAAIPPSGRYVVRLGDTVTGKSTTKDVATITDLKELYPVIKDRTRYLYFIGEFEYEDTSKRPHTTQFCVLIADPDAKELNFCKNFNELD